MRQLKPEYQKLRDNFAEQFEFYSCCSCHISPPCEFCIHEGNPSNLAENEDAWEDAFGTVGVKYATSSMIYIFMTDEKCKIGDKAAVFTNGNWNIVTIMEIHDEPQLSKDYNYTWLVQVIDRTKFDKHIKEDGEGYPDAGSRL